MHQSPGKEEAWSVLSSGRNSGDFNDQKGCQLSMDTTLFIYESVYALAEGTNLDHVVGKETTLLEFEDVYATDLTDTFIPYCMI